MIFKREGCYIFKILCYLILSCPSLIWYAIYGLAMPRNISKVTLTDVWDPVEEFVGVHTSDYLVEAVVVKVKRFINRL